MDYFLNLHEQATGDRFYQIRTPDCVPHTQNMQFDNIVKIPVAIKCSVPGPLDITCFFHHTRTPSVVIRRWRCAYITHQSARCENDQNGMDSEFSNRKKQNIS